MLGIPSEMDLITLLPFGYRTDSVGRGGRPKKSLSEITHGESFDEHFSVDPTNIESRPVRAHSA